jgi:multidrug efflux pump subunit AcrA (membrane-fusion protein)
MSFSLRGLLPILRLASRLPNSRPVAAAALRARSSELAELRARLAEAEAKSLAYAAARAMAEEARAAAEAPSLADASARAAAEEARAAAEEARAAAEATSLADAAAHAAEQKQHWFTRLEGMSPKPELASVDGVLGGFPSADGEAAAAAWVTACALTAGAWRPPSLKPAVAAAVLSENHNVHPIIHGVLSAIVGRNLRVWHNQETPDDAMAAAKSPQQQA